MCESGLQAVVLLQSLVCTLMKASLSGLMLVMATPATQLDRTATLQLQRAEISTTSTIHSPAFVSRPNMALPTSRTASNVSWVFEATYEVAGYLKASENLSEAEVLETTSGMEAYQQATEDARIQQRENQQQYKQEQAAAMEGMSQNRVQKFRQEKALDLREEMLTALFASHGRPFEDTTAESQRMGMTTLAFTKWQERQNRRHEACRRQ
ncbi:uncharacterized protein UHOD_11516 [Ustilago sp. UG-2017b]|nr:uncharacterized protein UHOD_11516 [Ustilago sp. UG-2017b]